MTIPYLAEVYGGPPKVVKEIAQSLGKANVDVDVIATNANGETKLEVPLNVWISEDSYRVKYFDCFHRNDLILSPSLGLWLSKNASDYSVVHTHNMFAPTMAIARWICRKKGVPYVTTPHGMLEPWALSYKASKKRIYYKHFEVPSLYTASAIHVLNQREAENVSSLGFSQTAIVPNGIYRQEFETLPDRELFYQQFPQLREKTIVLFLGRIDPKKGLDLLAPAFAQASQKFSEAHLVIAGPDSIDFLPTAQEYFREAGCIESVTFTGMLTGDIKKAALAAASVYVAPSYSEGFSMSVLEGMAAGLPCIITKECNFPEAAAAEVAHVVDLSSAAITDKLCATLSDLPRSQQMGANARDFVFDRYTWERVAQKLDQLYRTITTTPNSPVVNTEPCLTDRLSV